MFRPLPPLLKKSSAASVKRFSSTNCRVYSKSCWVCLAKWECISGDLLWAIGFPKTAYWSVKLDPVSRLGGNWYSRANRGLFEVEKPLRSLGIGVDSLPEVIKTSSVLTGNDLGMLANVETLPEGAHEMALSSEAIHQQASKLLQAGAVQDAWNLLMRK